MALYCRLKMRDAVMVQHAGSWALLLLGVSIDQKSCGGGGVSFLLIYQPESQRPEEGSELLM